MIYLSSLLFSTVATVLFIPMLMKLSYKIHALDSPGERKIHAQPIPRCGGFAMVLGGIGPILFWAAGNDFTRAYLAAVGVLVFFGAVDDIRGLGYKEKFLGQLIAGMIIVFYGGVQIKSLGSLLPEGIHLPAWLAQILSLLAVVGVTNAINLADGLDGLAGGISLLGFCCLGYLAYLDNQVVLVLISISLAGALFGFLRFNTHPAALFMGDTGSQLLGFSAVTLSIVLTQGDTTLSPLLPLIILGFPVLDTLTVMAERMAQGKSPFSADRNHFHHRLMRFGFSHRDAVSIIYGLQAMLILSAFFFRFDSEWVLLIGYCLFALLIVTAFQAADRRGWKYRRIQWIDSSIKGPLRTLVEKGILIRLSFRAMEFGLPALLLFTAFLPASLPGYTWPLAVTLALGLILLRWARPGWLPFALPVSIYLLVPFLVYFSATGKAGWVGPLTERAQNIAYLWLTLSIVLVLKFTRRREGFRGTPLDFLVLFLIAVLLPQLPFENLDGQQIRGLSAKLLILFFAIEVLVGELRGKLDRFGAAAVIVLIVIAVRGAMN